MLFILFEVWKEAAEVKMIRRPPKLVNLSRSLYLAPRRSMAAVFHLITVAYRSVMMQVFCSIIEIATTSSRQDHRPLPYAQPLPNELLPGVSRDD